MIKQNKFNKFNTSFAQNILSKYGIGRWKGQFSRLIFRNRSDVYSESGDQKELLNYTEVKKYNTILKVYKYIHNASKNMIIPGSTRILTIKPALYSKSDNSINISALTEIRNKSNTEINRQSQTVVFKTDQLKQYFLQRDEEKTVSVFNRFAKNIYNRKWNITNRVFNYDKNFYQMTDAEGKKNALSDETNTTLLQTNQIIKEHFEHKHQRTLEKEITYKDDNDKSTVVQQYLYKSELPDNINVQLKQSELILNTFAVGKLLTVSPSGIFKNRVLHETSIVNKNDIINKNSIINKLQSTEKLGHPQNIERKLKINEVHSFSEYDMFYSTQKQNFKQNILRENELKEIEANEYEKFVYFLPQKNKTNTSTDLVFYRPQLKEKEQEKKEILPMDVMHAEKNVYAKAASSSKPDKKLQTIGNEEVKVLADRVFQILEKRLAIQKDRRGLR